MFMKYDPHHIPCQVSNQSTEFPNTCVNIDEMGWVRSRFHNALR